ncbi:MAG: dockerin type I repeat-containing protein, partial [Clostridia bacterium]|nr:dockerin type I repeat-containing protein [Clostridia bacterium]
IVYSGDNGEYSDAEFHTTSFALTTDEEILKNYGDIVFSSLLDKELEWEIAPLRVQKAEQMQEKIFRAEGYTFEEITNLPEDFAEYFDVKVFDATNEEIAPNNGTTWNFVNIGRYRVQILFKTGMNKSKGGKFDNVKWSDNSRSPYQVVLTIKKLVFTVDGWTDCDGLQRPELISDDVDEIEKYFDYVIVKQADNSIIGVDEDLEYATYYTISIKVKEEFAGNVFVNYGGAEVKETAPFAFRTENPDELPPLDYFDKPTQEQLTKTYTTSDPEEVITFELGDWFVPAEMEVISGDLSGKGFGEYQVVVGFKAYSSYAWGPEDSWSRSPVTATFIIKEEGSGEVGKFILIDEMKDNHPFKFQYEDYKVYDKDISEYVYSEADEVFMTRLAFNDTLADLLAQFKNGNEIKVFDAKDVEITDMTKVLATGIVLRLMDGTTVLNQLTISVLGDIDGDGKIGTLDKAQLNAYTLGTRKLEGAKLLACDIDGDNKIGTLDKAQLNAYTLGTRDLYSKLTLKSSAKSASVAVVASEEVKVKSEEKLTSAIVAAVTEIEDIAEEYAAATKESVVAITEIGTTAETVENPTLSEEVAVNSEKVRNNSIEETPIIFGDTRRYEVSF